MGDVVELRSGLATSVGPVPFTDPDEAVGFVLASQPALPTVPVSGTGPASLLSQAVEGVPGLSTTTSGGLEIDAEALQVERSIELADAGELGLGPSFGALRTLLDAVPAHGAVTPGFVGLRVPLLGPVTLALALRGAGLDLGRAGALSASVVARRAEALLGTVRRSLPDRVVLVCLNEPGLVGGMHPTFPLSPTEVLDLLDPVVQRLDRHPRVGRLLIGAHVPGRTDWETVIASGISVLSMPAGAGLAGSAIPLGGFLERGGRISWGVVPVDQPLGTSEELLWRRLSAVWCELVGEGLDPLVLRNRSLVSPVDGLGHFGSPQASLAMDLVDSISTRVGRQAVAARLSLGA